ncbi:MAG: AsmA family protein, partial [Chloroflexota bacterium]
MKTRRWLIALLLSVLAVVVVPLTVSLGPLRAAAVRAFERQWGRPVEVGRVQAQFLPEPGLRSYRVKVSDLEAFGAEPFLQAQEVYWRLKLGSLIRGRLECTRLHLVRPSLNLVRNAQGAWNLALWAQRAALSWPVVSAEEARINFKQGAEKKIYALADARFSLQATP